jgi:hypothetical protein
VRNDTKSNVFCNIFILQFHLNVLSLQSVIRMFSDYFHANLAYYQKVQRSDLLLKKRFGVHEYFDLKKCLMRIN